MKKKIIAISILVLILSFFTFNFIKVRADSGWDTSYDSDWGSSSYDSDWDSDWSSSSWDSSDYSYSGGSGGEASPVVTLFILFIVFLFIISILRNSGKNQPHINPHQGNSDFGKTISEEEIKKTISDFNKKEFLDQAYQTFVDVQNAWSEFNYDELRKLLTDELYNSYHSQLIALKAKKQKNLMEYFNKIKSDIVDFKVDGNKATIKVALTVSFYDYVVDKDNKVVRGNKNLKLTNSYDLTFVSTLDKKDKKASKKKDNKTCPSCGAPLKNSSSNVCEYCGSNIVFKNHDWILSKKEIRR